MSYRMAPADGFPFYGVFQRVDSPVPPTFYVAETYMCIDGPRTRVARGGFHTIEAAQAWIEEKAK